MTAPRFTFTDRAIPVVEFGRSEHRIIGTDRWSQPATVWGTARWGGNDWETVWTETTCEIHQITVDVGRGGATDRFTPGTAQLVASNVHQLSDMIFPHVDEDGFELVPQPPITHEEDLQAPNAATVTSNGWSFSDDFETVGHRWVFPEAWADTGTAAAPAGPFKLVTGAFEPELYWDGDQFAGTGVAHWTRSYPTGDVTVIEVAVTNLDWPATPTGGSPQTVIELFLAANSVDQECYAARFTLTPAFPGANTIDVDIVHMAADGSTVDGVTATHNVGTGGVFGARTFKFNLVHTTTGPLLSYDISGVDSGSWTPTTELGAGRVGMRISVTLGELPGGADVTGGPRITRAVGVDLDDDFTRPLGSGWQLPARWAAEGYTPMLQHDGAMQPTQRFVDTFEGQYLGSASMTQWVSDFDGDQYVEVEITGMSFPDPVGGTINQTYLELYTQAAADTRSALVAYINYQPGWGTTNNRINWQLWRYLPNGEIVDYEPPVGDTIDLGDTNGVFPEPERWRIESDIVGTQRLYRNGTLVYTMVDPNGTIGPRVGVGVQWGASGPPTGEVRPSGFRIEQFSGGLQEPLGTEQLGGWIRIGVDHETLGRHWLFHGFVDGLEPDYDPNETDRVRIDCIDSLGEAGRVPIDGDQLPNRLAPTPNRIRQVLNAASWPKKWRAIHDDATVMSRPGGGKALDALTHLAESCGGAVYGDPANGDVVFKGRDWQTASASALPTAYITNYQPDFELGVPRVCPSGWERTAQRQDMTTRVKFSTETSDTPDGKPIVREWRAPAAEDVYGVEKYERTLLCTSAPRLNKLAGRQLRLRHPNQYPRIEAVTLDAATADDALDLMTTATFTLPSHYACQHREGDVFVFNRYMLVTGVRHRITPDEWTCRLTLDPSSVFAQPGGRWGDGRWGFAEWGRIR